LKTFFDIILSYYTSTSLYYTTRVTCIIFITLRHSNRSHICLSSGSIILDQALNLILDIQIYMVKREMSVYKKYTEFRTPEATFLTKILTHTHHLAPATSFRIRRRSEKKNSCCSPAPPPHAPPQRGAQPPPSAASARPLPRPSDSFCPAPLPHTPPQRGAQPPPGAASAGPLPRRRGPEARDPYPWTGRRRPSGLDILLLLVRMLSLAC
jgi:hypothetical protein